METSRKILSQAGLYPKLQLGIKNGRGVTPTGPHKVKMIEDKLIKKLNADGAEEHFVRYIVEEDGQRKQYDCHMKAKVGNDPHYLVQALAEVEPGEELILEMKKAGVKSYIEVTRVGLNSTERVEMDGEDQGEVTFEDEPNLE
jgi:hypothetical protein